MASRRISLVFVLILTAVMTQAAEPSMGPVISDFGPTYSIDYRDVPLPEDFVYRAVFDIAEQTGKADTVNQKLVSVARFLNMYARNGIESENMDLAVVFHGNAMRNALSNEAYLKRYETMNPNQELLLQLDAAGVKFYICGQSMEFARYSKAELAAPVKVALSAMSMLTILQTKGYALLP